MISAGEEGIAEFWDYRIRKKVLTKIMNNGEDLTKVACDNSGLIMGMGSADGLVRIFDLR